MVSSHCGRTWLFLSCLSLLTIRSAAASQAQIEGITFDGDGRLYAPLREVADSLSLPVKAEVGRTWLGEREVVISRRTFDGTALVPIREFQLDGAKVEWNPELLMATITLGEAEVGVVRPDKRVEIDLGNQTLTAFQGARLVMKTKISSGRPGFDTNPGSFTAGPIKHRKHFSSLYDNAPMPWAVQVDGDVFIHGYKDVPDYPASHGCIRMPLTGGNAARWFFEWVERGTPIDILNGGEH